MLRAVLAGGSGDNINLLVTELVFYGIGFFGLLLSAFILVNNRFVYLSHLLPCLTTPSSSLQLTGVQPHRNLISRIASEKRLFRAVLATAVGLGIAASTMMTPDSSPSTMQTGKTLRTVSTVLFLVLCCALGLHTLFVVGVEHEGSSFIQYRRLTVGPLIHVLRQSEKIPNQGHSAVVTGPFSSLPSSSSSSSRRFIS